VSTHSSAIVTAVSFFVVTVMSGQSGVPSCAQSALPSKAVPPGSLVSSFNAWMSSASSALSTMSLAVLKVPFEKAIFRPSGDHAQLMSPVGGGASEMSRWLVRPGSSAM